MGQDLERHVVLQAGIFQWPDAPTALSVHLQQEHVVRVVMRAHTAAIGGVGDHQIVQARIGHEAELLQQVIGCRHVQIQSLHQQGPAGLLHRRQAASAQRAVGQLPLARRSAGLAASLLLHRRTCGVFAHDQARLNIFLARQRKQLGALDGTAHTGNRLANQQRLFLPVLPHEGFRRHAAQQRRDLVDGQRAGRCG